jgi:acyl-CoA synthetase (AMP-forming)/AMP-acid ligase II
MFVLQAGATLLSMTHFDPGAALAQIAAERPTLIYPCFPAIASALFNHPDFGAVDMAQVRVMINVAPVDTLRGLQAQLPHVAQIGSYGLTEGGGVVSFNDWQESEEDRLNTVGPPLRGMEVRIVDPESGSVLQPDQPGEMQVRGIGVFGGYYKDQEKTAATLDAEGWLHTGDLCSVDENGRIRYLGRYKEMLKVGGENVAPAEIESFLSTHPAVKLCMAVGVPDSRLTEVAAAFVELKEGTTATEEELIAFCKGKIASYKVPRYVRFVTEWPMSATKVQRFRLRDDLMAELDAST